MHCTKKPLQVLYPISTFILLLFAKKKKETFWIGQTYGDIGGFFYSNMITIILGSFCILSFHTKCVGISCGANYSIAST